MTMAKRKVTQKIDPLTTLALAQAHARDMAYGLATRHGRTAKIRTMARHIMEFMRRTEQIAAARAA
jgi:hypothetical protein